MQNKLSLIIAYTHNDKDENRLIGLTALMDSIGSQTYRNFETIVVEDLQGKESGLFPFKNKVDKVITITDPEKRKFNKSWVMNVGARYASTDNLILIDAEIKFGKDFLQKVVDFMPGKPVFNCWSEYVCMPGRDNPNERRHYFPRTIRAMIGAWFCNKHFYFKTLGGYTENYFGYGAEDNAVFHRIKYLHEPNDDIRNRADFWKLSECNIPIMPYTIYHIYHHWHPADGPDPILPNDNHATLAYEHAHPWEVIQKLRVADIGNPKHPTLIDIQITRV